MKPLPFFLALAAAPLFGADTPLPEFNSNTIGPPPLSLREAGKPSAKSPSFSSALPTVDELTRDGFPGTDKGSPIPSKPAPPRFSSKSAPGSMPILEPNPNIDYKIGLKAPDPRIDFKMLVQPRADNSLPAK